MQTSNDVEVRVEEESSHSAVAMNFGVVVSDYYTEIADGLLSGVLHKIKQHSNFTYEVVRVEGAWELPVVAKTLLESERFQGIVALGCVIRGETSHFDYICENCSRALMDISTKFTTPIGFGILTADNMNQAVARSRAEQLDLNKGAEAAVAVIRSAYAIASIRQES